MPVSIFRFIVLFITLYSPTDNFDDKDWGTPLYSCEREEDGEKKERQRESDVTVSYISSINFNKLKTKFVSNEQFYSVFSLKPIQ